MRFSKAPNLMLIMALTTEASLLTIMADELETLSLVLDGIGSDWWMVGHLFDK